MGPLRSFGLTTTFILAATLGLAANLPTRANSTLAARRPAPSWENQSWLNTATPLTLKDLSGKVVLLNFWVFTCYNCTNTVPSLVDFDHRYRDKGLVVIGIHTPEFPPYAGEHDKANVARALRAVPDRISQRPGQRLPHLEVVWYSLFAQLVLIDKGPDPLRGRRRVPPERPKLSDLESADTGTPAGVRMRKCWATLSGLLWLASCQRAGSFQTIAPGDRAGRGKYPSDPAGGARPQAERPAEAGTGAAGRQSDSGSTRPS